jgi:hypothetical protein
MEKEDALHNKKCFSQQNAIEKGIFQKSPPNIIISVYCGKLGRRQLQGKPKRWEPMKNSVLL